MKRQQLVEGNMAETGPLNNAVALEIIRAFVSMGTSTMEKYMVEEKRIRDVINSRDDLSACGVEGVSHQLFKATKQGSVEFMTHIIKASIRCGQVMTS
jgi:hypothetical protein